MRVVAFLCLVGLVCGSSEVSSQAAPPPPDAAAPPAPAAAEAQPSQATEQAAGTKTGSSNVAELKAGMSESMQIASTPKHAESFKDFVLGDGLNVFLEKASGKGKATAAKFPTKKQPAAARALVPSSPSHHNSNKASFAKSFKEAESMITKAGNLLKNIESSMPGMGLEENDAEPADEPAEPQAVATQPQVVATQPQVVATQPQAAGNFAQPAPAQEYNVEGEDSDSELEGAQQTEAAPISQEQAVAPTSQGQAQDETDDEGDEAAPEAQAQPVAVPPPAQQANDLPDNAEDDEETEQDSNAAPAAEVAAPAPAPITEVAAAPAQSIQAVAPAAEEAPAAADSDSEDEAQGASLEQQGDDDTGSADGLADLERVLGTMSQPSRGHKNKPSLRHRPQAPKQQHTKKTARMHHH